MNNINKLIQSLANDVEAIELKHQHSIKDKEVYYFVGR